MGFVENELHFSFPSLYRFLHIHDIRDLYFVFGNL